MLHGVCWAQMEHQIKYGELWQHTGYVFTQSDGLSVDAGMVSKVFPKLVKPQGLPHLPFHGLRHAHATLALGAGVNVKVISERLGHSSVAATMDIYSHVLPTMQRKAMDDLDNLLSA